MKNDHLLWVDDEIDLLKPHVMFLQSKGYEVSTVTNGQDALDLCRETTFDLIFLDENMPGLSGLQTLPLIKEICPTVPVVMITKSEEENIMDMAIGSKIADYLIKPVNPNQILLSLKKNLHQKEIVTEVANTGYQQNFGKIGMQINDSFTYTDWMEVYKRLVYWELELEGAESSMTEMLAAQKTEANSAFIKFVKKNYLDWIANPESRPLISPDVFKKKIFPVLDAGEKVFFIVLDNFRYDQWRVLSNELADYFSFEEELYFSILPTATQYARNAIFSGLMPNKIAEMFPDLWVDEDEEEGKNLNEAPLIQTHIERYRRKNTFSYNKINDSAGVEKLLSNLNNLKANDLNVVVLNFIDMLSHARTESKMVRELASTEAAYRSITLSWFRHSSIKELFKVLSESDYRIVITTDHGTIRVDNPIKVIGDRSTNTNLRYKLGKNLSYNLKEVFEIKDPRKAQLPCPNVSTSYIFAGGRDFFAYPNNFNYYVSYYANTFQHGGISMEEMIIPLIRMQSKKR
ncbi:Response regulator receiver domain-containing protein [Bacteroides luti]|jgi:Response regulator containing CheY-like receiver, AAA-type ATPase, and DNA-binding domains|uniref:Response regulator receiver domain-containing protein n=1 Tax=Bacteroides luti TaxID=1297750 RepID=A0A1M5HD92_9BACE|nr:bifunctional response regulator/alkaline phosphatase family protein [Bacteroides luti]SHG13848.1 Response regulator receiver domain-containing protein [Bacteroides luti]